MTCARKIILKMDDEVVTLQKETYHLLLEAESKPEHLTIKTVGLFLTIESRHGVSLLWDKGKSYTNCSCKLQFVIERC